MYRALCEDVRHPKSLNLFIPLLLIFILNIPISTVRERSAFSLGSLCCTFVHYFLFGLRVAVWQTFVDTVKGHMTCLHNDTVSHLGLTCPLWANAVDVLLYIGAFRVCKFPFTFCFDYIQYIGLLSIFFWLWLGLFLLDTYSALSAVRRAIQKAFKLSEV